MITIIALIIAFAAAITIHEAAHAWMADRLGDPTPRMMGRLSLNPIVHYDQVGTTMLIVTAILTYMGLFPFPFGWAKPVRFDPFNLDNPRRDAALISIAGPASNMILAAVSGIILRGIMPGTALAGILTSLIFLNVVLAIFNLVPIHPLDGGKIFVGLLPESEAREADIFLRRYGTIILLFLIFPIAGGRSALFSVIGPVISFFINLLIPSGFNIYL